MRVLILGVDGMLGHIVRLYFTQKGHTVKGTSRSGSGDYSLDVTKNIDEVESFISDFKPDAIINCIGILNQVAEDHKSLAVMVNSYLPQYLDEICAEHGVEFVHISTDCVFDGKKGEYNEDSMKDAVSFYGQSKALGEVNNDRSLTLRTSIVGPDTNAKGVGLFQWFMNQHGETNGFDKVIWTGVTTIELAKCIEKAIDNKLTGLRHVVNNEKIDKYSLLGLFKKHFNKDIIINRKSDYISDKSLLRTTDFDFGVPSYDQMVKEMSEWVSSHEQLYPESQRVIK